MRSWGEEAQLHRLFDPGRGVPRREALGLASGIPAACQYLPVPFDSVTMELGALAHPRRALVPCDKKEFPSKYMVSHSGVLTSKLKSSLHNRSTIYTQHALLTRCVTNTHIGSDAGYFGHDG